MLATVYMQISDVNEQVTADPDLLHISRDNTNVSLRVLKVHILSSKGVTVLLRLIYSPSISFNSTAPGLDSIRTALLLIHLLQILIRGPCIIEFFLKAGHFRLELFWHRSIFK